MSRLPAVSSIPQPLFRKAVRLAVPIAGAYLVVVIGLLLELIIVGRVVGPAGVGAIGLAGTLLLVLILSFHALEVAVQSITARRLGENNTRAVGATLDNALIFSIGLGILLTGGLMLLGPQIFRTAESEDVRNLAFEYFRYRLPGLPFLIATLAMIGFFNAISRPHIPMYIYAGVLALNIFFCVILVAKPFGLPSFGISGAGMAQSISAIIGFIVFIIVILSGDYRERFRCFHFLTNFHPTVFKGFIILGLPIFGQQFFGNIATYAFPLINSAIADDGVSLAATTLARNIAYLTYLPSLGFGIAAATLVSQYLGRRQSKRAAQSVMVCWMTGAALMMTGGLVFILFGGPLSSIFFDWTNSSSSNHDPELTGRVKTLAANLLIIIGCFQIFEATNTILGKALQSAGASLYVMLSSLACQWLIFVPLAWFLALKMEFGAIGAMLALLIQLIAVATMHFFKFRSGGWKKIRV